MQKDPNCGLNVCEYLAPAQMGRICSGSLLFVSLKYMLSGALNGKTGPFRISDNYINNINIIKTDCCHPWVDSGLSSVVNNEWKCVELKYPKVACLKGLIRRTKYIITSYMDWMIFLLLYLLLCSSYVKGKLQCLNVQNVWNQLCRYSPEFMSENDSG